VSRGVQTAHEAARRRVVPARFEAWALPGVAFRLGDANIEIA
jgi:hypothetical protein